MFLVLFSPSLELRKKEKLSNNIMESFYQLYFRKIFYKIFKFQKKYPRIFSLKKNGQVGIKQCQTVKLIGTAADCKHKTCFFKETKFLFFNWKQIKTIKIAGILYKKLLKVSLVLTKIKLYYKSNVCCIDLIPTNRKHCFEIILTFDTDLSDSHEVCLRRYEP